jgi:hypothetical protein
MRELALPPISPLELAAAGEALYGRDWRAALCDVLNVTTTELAMVECGQLPAPEAWRAVLVNLAQEIAYRALEAASALLACNATGAEEMPSDYYAPQQPLYA